MRLSARNALKGKVTDIKRGAVMAQVTLDVAGQTIKAAILLESVDELGLKVGDEAYAVVKATEVMIAKD